MAVTISRGSAQATTELDQAMIEQEQARSDREQANANILLFQLPAELRNSIYISALTHPLVCKFFISQYGCTLRPNVLRISRQIRRETLPLFYSQCRFTLLQEDLYFGNTWFRKLPTDALRLLRKVSCNVRVAAWNMPPAIGGDTAHQLRVNIDRDSEGFRCSITCGLEKCKKGTGVDPLGCHVARTISARATTLLNRMKGHEKDAKHQREFLLELMALLNDAQARGLAGWSD